MGVNKIKFKPDGLKIVDGEAFLKSVDGNLYPPNFRIVRGGKRLKYNPKVGISSGELLIKEKFKLKAWHCVAINVVLIIILILTVLSK